MKKMLLLLTLSSDRPGKLPSPKLLWYNLWPKSCYDGTGSSSSFVENLKPKSSCHVDMDIGGAMLPKESEKVCIVLGLKLLWNLHVELGVEFSVSFFFPNTWLKKLTCQCLNP